MAAERAKAERAKGFLEGVACATHLGLQADPPDCSDEGAEEMSEEVARRIRAPPTSSLSESTAAST